MPVCLFIYIYIYIFFFFLNGKARCLFVGASVLMCMYACERFCPFLLCLLPSIYVFYPSIHLSICLFVYLSICLSIHPFIHPFICLYVCQSSCFAHVCLFVYLSIYLFVSICRSAYPSVYLFIFLLFCVSYPYIKRALQKEQRRERETARSLSRILWPVNRDKGENKMFQSQSQ